MTSQGQLSASRQQVWVLEPGSVNPGLHSHTMLSASQYLFFILLEPGQIQEPWSSTPDNQLQDTVASLFLKMLPCFKAFAVLCMPAFPALWGGRLFWQSCASAGRLELLDPSSSPSPLLPLAYGGGGGERWAVVGSSSEVWHWAGARIGEPRKGGECRAWAGRRQCGSSQFRVNFSWSSEQNCELETRGQDKRCETPEPKRSAFRGWSAACWVERSPWVWSSWGDRWDSF